MVNPEHRDASFHAYPEQAEQGRRLDCAKYARNLHLHSCAIQIAHRELLKDQALSVKNIHIF